MKFLCHVSSYVQIRVKVEIKSVLLGFHNVKASSIHSVKYQRCATSGCKAIEIEKIVLVASNQCLSKFALLLTFTFCYLLWMYGVCVYICQVFE